jgi:beta-lactamase regulating signal transducer with metallopeptidase domain
MMFAAFWNEALTAALVNHLWQSTLVVLIAWLLTVILRGNQARTRYCVWMVASVKFLIPFSLLISAGESLRVAAATPIPRPVLGAVMEQIAQPFPQTASPRVNPFTESPFVGTHHTNLLAAILFAVWLCGFLAIVFWWARGWWQIRAAVRAASQISMLGKVPVLSSPCLLEPGVFGIICPVLLLPEKINDRLSAAQLNVIVAHELCHVLRRDNLTAAVLRTRAS